jgi:HAD superfamily hydrolase (TIGR01459 family)
LSGVEIPFVSGLSALAPRYDAIFCDVWGVLIDGTRHFPDAAEALIRFRAGGGRVALITNASRPSAEVARQLAGFGLPDETYDAIVSAGELTLREIVARRGQSCFHLGPPRDDGLFLAAEAALGAPVRRVGAEEADYVVCTGLVDDENERPEDYDACLDVLRARNLSMLCANPDVVVEVGDRLYFCAGAIARRYEAMGGETLMFGKPEPAIYTVARAALEGHATRPQRILAIGDGAETDLAGAGRADIDCLFIVSGVHREEVHDEDGELDSMALCRLFTLAKARPKALANDVVW